MPQVKSGAGVIRFLNTDRSKEDLAAALAVLREFKAHESLDEWAQISFEAWAKLEQLQEYLEYLVEGKALKADSIGELVRWGCNSQPEEKCVAELPTMKSEC